MNPFPSAFLLLHLLFTFSALSSAPAPALHHSLRSTATEFSPQPHRFLVATTRLLCPACCVLASLWEAPGRWHPTSDCRRDSGRWRPGWGRALDETKEKGCLVDIIDVLLVVCGTRVSRIGRTRGPLTISGSLTRDEHRTKLLPSLVSNV
jgi:hypothetical protein